MKMSRPIKILLLAILLVTLASCSNDRQENYPYTVTPIYPDYIGVTIPRTIAPLNFAYTIDGADDCVTTFSCGTQSVTFHGPEVEWKEKQWHKLLEELPDGGDIIVRSSVPDTIWTIHVSPDPIDFGLAYRLVSPGYETAGYMGIFERDLSSFKEKGILENTQFDCCMNCHSFNRCSPEDLSLHIRGGHAATIIRKDGVFTAYDTKTDSTLAACVYPYWHPSGDYIAYSTNETRQCFHIATNHILDVYDIASDLQVYDIRNNSLISGPSVKSDSIFENYPAFSTDGKWLYFCSCPARDIPKELAETKYNLCRVSFDATTGTIGTEIETLVDARSIGKNIAFPRPSYDGRFVMYTLFDSTAFPIWHDEADLWILNLESGETYPAEGANSDGPESYHSWSSNSRWFVFGSRRDDGRFTRAYIGHIDESGNCSKAFMLPQRHPLRYYSMHARSFNLPEFITGQVNLDRKEAQQAVLSDKRIVFKYRTSK